MTAYVLDTETTGQREKPQCIELAHVAVTLNNRKIDYHPGGEMWVGRFLPSHSITFGALAVHHILPHELQDYPPSSEAEIPSDAVYLIGHNIDYDWEVLGAPADVRRICTLALARRYLELDSHKLGACIYAISDSHPDELERTRDLLVNAHQAAVDIELCIKLLNHILQLPLVKHVVTFEDLWEVSEEARVPTKWTFGKFLGKRIEEADRGYLNWVLRQDSMDPYVKIAARKALER